MKLPQIDVRTTPIKISSTSIKGKLNIESSSATPQFNIEPGHFNIKRGKAEIIVDNSKTWEALNGGSHMKFIDRMYDQNGQYVIDGIRRRVEQYRQIGDLSISGNPIPDIAYQNAFYRPLKHQVFGNASIFNTELQANIEKPNIEYVRGKTEATYIPGKVNISYERGSVKTQVDQYPTIDISIK